MKRCEVCGGDFVRRASESKASYAKRRACGVECGKAVRSRLSHGQVARMLDLLRGNQTYAEIARTVGCSVSVIAKYARRAGLNAPRRRDVLRKLYARCAEIARAESRSPVADRIARRIEQEVVRVDFF